jgi:hypothetical protein
MGFFCIYHNHSQYIEIIQLSRLSLERSLLPGSSISFEAEPQDTLQVIACTPPVTTMLTKKVTCAHLVA